MNTQGSSSSKKQRNSPRQKYVLKNNEENDCINSEDETLDYNNNKEIKIQTNFPSPNDTPMNKSIQESKATITKSLKETKSL